MSNTNIQHPAGPTGNHNPNIPVDRTMVEGADAVFNIPTAQSPSGTKLGVTVTEATNPYAEQQQNRGFQDLLPTGNDNIPLGSGNIVGVLGTGGMARVYKIWNEKLEIYRAVKILIPTQQPDLLERFLTEAKITAKVRHANIVEIYSVGDFDAGALKLPYLEMEYIDGETLESLIARYGKLPDAVSCAIAIAVAHALAYAHSQEFMLYGKSYKGIIHRDLKPANIMISSQGHIKLMDFGIARPTEASLHTVDGNIVGTMQYLSPEQLDGIDIDCRTDIYSFGAILYELLTGAKTFPQDTITNLMRKKITNTYRGFNEFDFAIDKDLSGVAQKCLELSKKNRYSNADELSRELERIFHALTADSYSDVMRKYLADPVSFSTTRRKKAFPVLKPLILIPAAALIVAAAVITTIVLTGPAKTAQNTVAQPVAVPAVPAPAPTQPQPQAVVQPPEPEIRPLSPAPAAATAEPPPPPTRERKVSTTVRPQQTKKIEKPVESSSPVPAKTGTANTLNALKQKYNTTDLVATGQKALEQRDFTGAITALENTPPGHPQQTLRVILLLEAYVETGKFNDAQALIAGAPITDAQYDILCGRLYQAQGKNKKALDLYQSGMIKPSVIRNMKQIRQDALYYTAVIWTEHYRKSPSPDSRLQATNAWMAVQRMYTDSQNNPRYSQAGTELSKMQN